MDGKVYPFLVLVLAVAEFLLVFLSICIPAEGSADQTQSERESSIQRGKQTWFGIEIVILIILSIEGIITAYVFK